MLPYLFMVVLFISVMVMWNCSACSLSYAHIFTKSCLSMYTYNHLHSYTAMFTLSLSISKRSLPMLILTSKEEIH